MAGCAADMHGQGLGVLDEGGFQGIAWIVGGLSANQGGWRHMRQDMWQDGYWMVRYLQQMRGVNRTSRLYCGMGILSVFHCVLRQ
jgi:hypothetical protein